MMVLICNMMCNVLGVGKFKEWVGFFYLNYITSFVASVLA